VSDRELRSARPARAAAGRSINDGSFREDLYDRLAVIEVRLPPLGARRDDIPVLAALPERRQPPTTVPPLRRPEVRARMARTGA
jgi:transcriptional regulator of acetoin/glycerol metabolism